MKKVWTYFAIAQQVSIPWGLVCTAFLLLPALFLVPVAGKKRD